MFHGVGLGELALIAFIVLMIFGARRLPEAGRGLGQALRQFKDALTTSPSEPKELDSAANHGKADKQAEATPVHEPKS